MRSFFVRTSVRGSSRKKQKSLNKNPANTTPATPQNQLDSMSVGRNEQCRCASTLLLLKEKVKWEEDGKT